MDTVLVTGATGTVGREVVRRLADVGVRVRAAARRRSAELLTAPTVDFAELDLDRPSGFDRTLDGVRRVFLLTPLHERMVEQAAALIERAAAQGVKHIVRLSAMGADFDPPITLGRVHRAVEALIEQSGIDYTFLRPNAFMQNYLTYFGASLRAAGVFHAPQGAGAVSLVDARDVAAAAVAALTDAGHAGRACDLTGREALTNEQVAAVLSRALGRPVRYVDQTEAEARAALRESGLSPWVVEVVLELYALSRAGGAARVTSGVRDLIGRDPISFEQFARDHAQHF